MLVVGIAVPVLASLVEDPDDEDERDSDDEELLTDDVGLDEGTLELGMDEDETGVVYPPELITGIDEDGEPETGEI